MLQLINIYLRVIARLNSVLSDHIATTSNSSLDHSLAELPQIVSFFGYTACFLIYILYADKLDMGQSAAFSN
jgi:hypothetical protein